MEIIDSHCHINFPDLKENLPELLTRMEQAQVTRALCVSVSLEAFPEVLALAEAHSNIYASVGVHPDHVDGEDPSTERLVSLAENSRVVAIGETGLDYFRLEGDLSWQRERFRKHIRAAKIIGKPLIIHTREAGADTIKIMQEEDAASVGGVMHCFTETWEVAKAAIEMNFLISFSGILTFKNARELRDVALQVPLESAMVETDSPYLAPVPHRGKTNEPSYVRHVAEELARIKNLPLETVAGVTSANFRRLFRVH